ncbi:hypothetical protein ACFQ3S_15765 [Mucilaginibacter terrae]|uniref:hypothetical protein n=1 Tax=Mucilaginibacter terrae TaxID=1955052 RepID=UPI003635549B
MQQPVYTLLCKRDIPMAQATLPGILKALQPKQQLNIFDDGTFTPDDVALLSDLSASIRIVTLAQRNEEILGKLANYKNCLKYRGEFPLAFKMLDIPLLAAKDATRITFTDSDIIYLKDCEGYFNRDVNTYLRTDAIKLSVKLSQGLLKYHWKMPLRFNSGYFSFDLKDYDLDFVDHYLGLPDVRHMPWLSEQTCWSLLFGKAGKSYSPKENEFACRENFTGPKPDTLAIHLIGKLKSKVNEWSIELDANKTAPIKPEFELSRNINMLDWVQKTARRFSPFK